MNITEALAKTYGSERAVDDPPSVRPGRLSRLVIASVRSIIAKVGLGPRFLTRARRAPTG